MMDTTTTNATKTYYISIAHPNGVNCFQTNVIDRDADTPPIPTLEEDLFVKVDKLFKEDRIVGIIGISVLSIIEAAVIFLYLFTDNVIFLIVSIVDTLPIIALLLTYNYTIKLRLKRMLRELKELHPTILTGIDVTMKSDEMCAPVYTMVFETAETDVPLAGKGADGVTEV